MSLDRPFTIYPAIDLKGGQCVRLLQGRAEDVTVYGEDPVEMARHWEQEGARWLHLVDLDGAFEGAPRHTEVIARVAAEVSMPVQVGGGMRTDDDIIRTLDVGVARVILGTRVLADLDDLRRLVDLFGERLAVGIDARGGRVQVKGWTETTDTSATELAREVGARGIPTLVYTDTATDGMLAGTNVKEMDAVCTATPCEVIASGGVSGVEDVRALKALERRNLAGAIVGKALYEQRVTLREMQEA